MKAVVVDCDVLTAYGRGLDACWRGLLSGKTAISTVHRFETGACRTSQAGIIPFLDPGRPESLCMQMLESLFEGARSGFPDDAMAILASTTGEIDLLERSFLHGEGSPEESCLTNLLKKTQHLLGNRSEGLVISTACTSSAAAIIHAAALVGAGACDSVLVVSCDAVTEFVFAGFSSLLALSEERATPFDRDCCGLTLGEAAAYALIMSEDRALREGKPIMGEIAGWGMTNDTNHMTGPSRDGRGLARAIETALGQGLCGTGDVGSVCAHGTGTAYNDNMEMMAFRLVFGDLCVPVYSIKGGIGHTLGAAGLVELAVLLRSMREGAAPPTVGCKNVIDNAVGWVSPASQTLKDLPFALCTNSGFGGINTALLLRAREIRVSGCAPGCMSGRLST